MQTSTPPQTITIEKPPEPQPNAQLSMMPKFAMAKGGYVTELMRDPVDTELEYFKNNPNVTGMATEDNRVILNPYSKLSDREKEAVALNEAARVKMRTNPDLTPNFDLTPEQTKFLNSNTYKEASDTDRKATIAARILSGDPSAGTPTQEQLQFVDTLKKNVVGEPQPEKMAKGGQVMKQTARMLKEGGMMQDGGTVDPESGNKVPVGAMQEEVRDDVPAQLSEGEFVFPADVVRYIGLERLMQMRQAAKKGLMQMEEMGQMSNGEDATEEEDTAEFESQIDDIMGELGEEDEDEVKMAKGGDVVDADEAKFQKEIKETGWYKEYKKEYGEEPDLNTKDYDYRAAWKAGVRPERDPYDKNRYHWASSDPKTGDMLKSKEHPTAWKEEYMRKTGKNPDEVGVKREDVKMQAGGMVAPPTPAVAQTQQALSQDQQVAPPLTEDQLTAIQTTAERMKAQKLEIPPEQQSKPTEGIKASDIIRQELGQSKPPEEVDTFIKKVARLEKTNKLLNIRHNDTVILGFVKSPGVVDPLVFTQDTPDRMQEAIAAGFFTAKQAGIKRLESSTKNPQVVKSLQDMGYPAEETQMGWSLDL